MNLPPTTKKNPIKIFEISRLVQQKKKLKFRQFHEHIDSCCVIISFRFAPNTQIFTWLIPEPFCVLLSLTGAFGCHDNNNLIPGKNVIFSNCKQKCVYFQHQYTRIQHTWWRIPISVPFRCVADYINITINIWVWWTYNGA